MTDSQDQHRDIVTIGGSAGSVEAVTQVLHHLPSDLPAAIFISLHFPSYGKSALPQILSRATSLPVNHPQDGEKVTPGRIYIAPPNFHLLLESGYIRLSQGPRENGHRPAIDPLFRSAAKTYKQRVIGIILSGLLDDGTAGLAAIKQQGGLTIAQDPDEALFNAMINSAIDHVVVDRILPVAKINSVLANIAQIPLPSGELLMPNDGDGKREEEIVSRDKAALEHGEKSGAASMLTCPDCGGVLWELQEQGLLRYRCHVGHAYSAESLVDGQSKSLEIALWSAIRALEERAALLRRLAAQARTSQRSHSEARFLQRADDSAKQADAIRQIVTHTPNIEVQ